MLVIRWLLSKLTLFILFFIVGYFLFNWYLANSSLQKSVVPVGKIQSVNDDTALSVDNTYLEVVNKKDNLTGNVDKLDPTEKTEPDKKVQDEKIVKFKQAIVQQPKKSDNNKKKVINKQQYTEIYPEQIEKESTKQSTLDELVTLLMSGKQSLNYISDYNDELNKKNQLEQKWELARAYYSSKNYFEAEKEYLELIQLEPEFEDFYGELSNLYFVKNEIKKYNDTLTTLTRLYIKNKKINMARYIISLLKEKSPELAKMLEQELQQKYSDAIL